MSGETSCEMQFDHLGLIVSDIAGGRDFLRQTLGISHWTEVTDDAALGVSVQFGTAHADGSPQGPAYELVAPFGDDSPIATALRAGKNILNHVAYLTADMVSAADHLRVQGCFPAGEAQPAVAYGGRRVQFFVSPLRFLIEIIESPGHSHRFVEATDK